MKFDNRLSLDVSDGWRRRDRRKEGGGTRDTFRSGAAVIMSSVRGGEGRSVTPHEVVKTNTNTPEMPGQ